MQTTPTATGTQKPGQPIAQSGLSQAQACFEAKGEAPGPLADPVCASSWCEEHSAAAVWQSCTLATLVRAALSPASSRSSASLSSLRVDSFQMSPAWQWSFTAADQKASQLPFRPPDAW